MRVFHATTCTPSDGLLRYGAPENQSPVKWPLTLEDVAELDPPENTPFRYRPQTLTLKCDKSKVSI